MNKNPNNWYKIIHTQKKRKSSQKKLFNRKFKIIGKEKAELVIYARNCENWPRLHL